MTEPSLAAVSISVLLLPGHALISVTLQPSSACHSRGLGLTIKLPSPVPVIGMYLSQHASAEHHIPVSESEHQNCSFSAQSCTNYNLVYVSFLINFGYGQDVANGMNLAFHSIAATGPEITQACHSYLSCLKSLLT